MTHIRSHIPVFLSVLALCFTPAQAQQNSKTSSEVNDALRQKAFEVLESVASQISTLQSAENRARIGSNIAESIWDHDEKRARALLVSVQNEINSVLQNQLVGQPIDEQTRMVFIQLRINTVERIAKHDGELALSFLESTEPNSSGEQKDGQLSRRYNSEDGFELRLAKGIAAKNPEIALSLARRAQARGLPGDIMPLLRELSRKHKEQAQNLTTEIIAKLKHADLGHDMAAFYFAQDLARRFAPPAMDDSNFRDLIDLFVSSAAANGCNKKLPEDDERASFCMEVGSLLPLIKKINPARATELKRWEPEPGEQEDSNYSDEDLTEVAQDGTVDEILALTSKYPQMEVQIRWSAIEKAQASGDLERARKIATDYIGDPEMQRRMLEEIDGHQKAMSEFKVKEKEFQATLDKLPNNEQRVRFLLMVANQVGATDQKQALKLLDQASSMIDSMKAGKDQIEAQTALALMLCSNKSDRGLSIMQSLMPKLNELVGAAAKLDGYENQYLRDGEWNMTREGTLGGILTRLSENAAYFAWCDFDRAVSFAGEFERPEIRLMAQLKLAQAILAGPPKPFGLDGPMVRYGP